MRSDGLHARSRLLATALRLFAENGFANTSTRQVATAAGVNIAAISYYFGDKAGLYRAAYTEPMGADCGNLQCLDHHSLPLKQALHMMLSHIVQPLKQGELVQLCMRLRYREMLEPTGLWAHEIDSEIKPTHTSLVQGLCKHLQLNKPDDDIHRLAHSILGLAINLYVGRDVVNALAPQLQASAKAIDIYTDRLVDYALAMVASEAKRRQQKSRKPAVKPHTRTISKRHPKPNKNETTT